MNKACLDDSRWGDKVTWHIYEQTLKQRKDIYIQMFNESLTDSFEAVKGEIQILERRDGENTYFNYMKLASFIFSIGIVCFLDLFRWRVW